MLKPIQDIGAIDSTEIEIHRSLSLNAKKRKDTVQIRHSLQYEKNKLRFLFGPTPNDFYSSTRQFDQETRPLNGLKKKKKTMPKSDEIYKARL
jgi:hypothetical protein